ncbi:MAG: hypothetical protein HY744_34010 [Deltaproteobacteria bacterium]|nr:hypothetical protein [Deltaproteobacteria bacterium]
MRTMRLLGAGAMGGVMALLGFACGSEEETPPATPAPKQCAAFAAKTGDLKACDGKLERRDIAYDGAGREIGFTYETCGECGLVSAIAYDALGKFAGAKCARCDIEGGCPKGSKPMPSGKCCDGYVSPPGKCEPKCDPAKCLPGNTCVGNQCLLLCDAHRDCTPGVQECAAAIEDDTGRPVQVCRYNGRYATNGGFGEACPFGDGQCVGLACPNGLHCDPQACGGNPAACELDLAACAGRARCNYGKCQGTGDACIFNTCPPEQCTPFRCLGAGEGDADAYCTHHDCQGDADCPAGYSCATTRDPHKICDTNKGNNNFCGKTAEPCIDPKDFGVNGASFFEGALCLLRRTCLKRESCASCATTLDCTAVPDQICAPSGAASACARLCTGDEHCLADETCTPSGKRTCAMAPALECATDADCAPVAKCTQGSCASGAPCAQDADCVAGSCVERSVCLPCSGFCRKEGGGGFCDHCVDDTDCGTPDGKLACVSPATGQSACFDLSFPDTCPSNKDTECPKAPSGLYGECLDQNEQVGPSDQVYHRCYFPCDDKKHTCGCWLNGCSQKK